jgi:FkbM family methyltransferase
VRRVREWYYNTFHNRPKAYTVRYNPVTGPYKLVMRLADGPGMRKRLRQGTEVEQREVFLPLIGPGWHCCDVGAHVGDYTIEMALCVGPEGKVYSYEAVPHYFELLTESIAANRLSNVVPTLAAVGAESGSIVVPRDMLTGNLGRPGRSVRGGEEGRPSGQAVEVPLVRLDDEIPRLDAIKVDCEGYEVKVLRGMRRLISKSDGPIVFLEVHDRQLTEVGNSLSELASLLLDECGLVVYRIGFKHCICSKREMPLEKFGILKTPNDFVTAFRRT